MRGSELAHAFRQLDNIMSRNKVRYQLKRTFRHEKKGAKRRRLKSERWRKQFANAVCIFSLFLVAATFETFDGFRSGKRSN